jgi:hypothetical protein
VSRPRSVPEDQLRRKKLFAYVSDDDLARICAAMTLTGQTSISEFLRDAAVERARVAILILPVIEAA